MSNISNTSNASSSTNPSSTFAQPDSNPFSAESSPWSSPEYGPFEALDPPPIIPGLPDSAIAEIKAAMTPPIGVGGIPIMKVNPAWSSPPVNVSGPLSKK